MAKPVIEKEKASAVNAKAASKGNLKAAPKLTKVPASETSASTTSSTSTLNTQHSPELISECREKLLIMKSDLLNRVKEARGKLDQFETGGDEADQTMRILAEQEMLNLTDRLRSQLMEIEGALARMESGAYGYCEETDEPIETERLKAIPWTRLSIEGAEIRESMGKRYAR